MDYICISVGTYPITIGKEYTDFSIKNPKNLHKNWMIHDEIKKNSIDEGNEQILVMNDRKLQWISIKHFKTRDQLRDEKLTSIGI